MSIGAETFEYRDWTVDQLQELVEDIKDVEVIVWNIEQEVRRRWNNGEDTPAAFFMLEDENGQYVANPRTTV